MSRARRSIAAVAAAVALVLVPTAAWADYLVEGTVSSRSLKGESGVSLAVKTYTFNVGGKTVCMKSSQLSSNDEINAAKFSRIIVRSGSTSRFGGYGDVINGRSISAYVNESASPAQCGGKKLAYLIYVNM
jgi:hypothetical protein